MLSSIPPLQNDEEDVSYDIESLYINIPIEANYIIEQIYVHKKLEAICLKLIFKRLLIKLTAEVTFNFNSIFLNMWMVPFSEDHCLLLVMTFIWPKWKIML